MDLSLAIIAQSYSKNIGAMKNSVARPGHSLSLWFMSGETPI